MSFIILPLLFVNQLLASALPEVEKPSWQPLQLSTGHFMATASTVRVNSSWGTANTHAPHPENFRSLTFWGHFVDGPCSTAAVAPVWGFTAKHKFTGAPSGEAFYPDCGGLYGPSLEADIVESGTAAHLIVTESTRSGPFSGFGAHGQNPSGANAHIAATYVDFNPQFQPQYANRMKPWSATYSDPSRLRVAIRVNQSVVLSLIPQPSLQQLQQVLHVCFINEMCDSSTSSSYCQISFNIKTHISGAHAYVPGSDATAFNDNGQGGLIVVVGPINHKGLSTNMSTSRGNIVTWTSWGLSTQSGTFEQGTFQVEITWDQFQSVLLAVTDENPIAVFGDEWNNRSAWVLLRSGYGQENWNVGNTTSSVRGLFQSMELMSVGS